MSLKFRFTTGPQTGKEFSINAGDTLGRAKCTIPLEDPKASNKHAKIEKDPYGSLILVDLGSTNGIRANNKRVKQITLVPGVIITIGNSSMLVEVAGESAAKAPTTQGETPMDWSTYLSAFSLKATEKLKNHSVPLQAFSPLVVLTFIRGPQLGSELVLGYGPRSVGLGSLDLPIYEEGAPLICFTVQSQSNRIYFSTEHSDKVLLNGKPVKTDILRAQDTIEILNTLIRVSFKE